MHTVTPPPPVSNGIHVQKPQPTIAQYEEWRRAKNWIDNTGTGLYHHVNHREIKTFEEVYNEFVKESV